MEVREGLEELLAENMVPQDRYRLRVVQVDEPRPERMEEDSDEEYALKCANFVPGWSKARCEIVRAKDPANNTDQIVGRRIGYWLVSTFSGRSNLARLLHHKALYDMEGGWQNGIPEVQGSKSTQNLVGVEFVADVKPFKKKDTGEWDYKVYPITQPGEWAGEPGEEVPF